MKCYPLVFRFQGLVAGNGFVAGVELAGRALLVEEESDFWVYGVNPGGFAASGDDRDEALNNFRIEYDAVLNDIAGDASSFDAFKAGVEGFLNEESDLDEWKKAVEVIRQSDQEFDWLPKGDADRPCSVKIVDLTEQASAAANRDPHDRGLEVAA